ncbi:hypothetical protein DENSPDRAFT_363994 [Dentipellis sp. KUC8613]|nr:hypothetical protein DENSPDRAFT_363994 [Dentipellis sp. KUC8613]
MSRGYSCICLSCFPLVLSFFSWFRSTYQRPHAFVSMLKFSFSFVLEFIDGQFEGFGIEANGQARRPHTHQVTRDVMVLIRVRQQ